MKPGRIVIREILVVNICGVHAVESQQAEGMDATAKWLFAVSVFPGGDNRDVVSC
jgi:hypothetical protein